MRRRRFFWHLYPALLTTTLVSMAAVVGYALVTVRATYLGETERELLARAKVSALLVEPSVRTGNDHAVDSLCRRINAAARTRMTVVHSSGRVIGDSEDDPLKMDNHADRPEVRAAFRDTAGVAVRFSSTLRRDLVYVAVPVVGQDSVLAVVRASMPLASVWAAVSRETAGLIAAAILVILASAGVSLFLARSLSRPVEELTIGAERFARGELARSLPVPPQEELGRLADSMNAMAAELDRRIAALTAQKSEQEAILSCMVEGVIAVDGDLRVLSTNAAARDLLGIDGDRSRGHLLQEAVRHTRIHDFVRKVLSETSIGFVEDRLTIAPANGPSRVLQLHGTVLRGRAGPGALVVLHDITRIQHLEDIRRDFVANVSHELRTPLTSIRGFVETLQQGAAENPADRARFLDIISRHVNRLGSLVDDLLTLSSVERDDARHEASLAPSPLAPLLADACAVVEPAARARGMSLRIDGETGVTVSVNAFLFEQAVVNLVDNAVKYGPAGSTVTVRARAGRDAVTVAVSDEGPGIPPEHLDRIFERFYRVDKARSRSLGGTGLGLSIVKHIMAIHRGEASVESVAGKGSTFTLRLPA